MLLIYDELDLPVGRVRVRETGGSGGQKGMKSILAAAGTQVVSRVVSNTSPMRRKVITRMRGCGGRSSFVITMFRPYNRSPDERSDIRVYRSRISLTLMRATVVGLQYKGGIA